MLEDLAKCSRKRIEKVKAFILGLIGTLTELEPCLERIRQYPQQKDSYLTYGIYDSISKVEVTSQEELTGFLNIIESLGVEDTETMSVDETVGAMIERKDCDKTRKSAYIFMKMRTPKDYSVLMQSLRENDNIVEAYPLHGRYDLVVSVREDARRRLFKKVIKHLRLLRPKGIASTTTCITVEI